MTRRAPASADKSPTASEAGSPGPRIAAAYRLCLRGPMQRLKKRADFLSVAKGARAGRRAFTLQAAKRRPRVGPNGKPVKTAAAPVTEPRVGFTVTKKVGNAVERNRIRRRLRAAIARLADAPAANDHDYVLVGRRDALTLDFAALLADLKGAFAQVMKPRAGGARKGAPNSDADRAAGASPAEARVPGTPLTDAPSRAPSRTDR